MLALMLVLSFAELSRGRDSKLRAWWDGLHVTRAEGGRFILDRMFRGDRRR